MSNSNQHRQKPPLNSIISTFPLSEFDQFTTQYKQTNHNLLAPEALLAFEQFLPALNKFFDFFDDLTEEIVASNTVIHWYSYTTAALSGDYVRASSKYYYNPEFSNISINMSEEEVDDYRSDQGVCFGKVC